MDSHRATGELDLTSKLSGLESNGYALAPISPQPRPCAFATLSPYPVASPTQQLGTVDLNAPNQQTAEALPPADVREVQHDNYLPCAAKGSLRSAASPRLMLCNGSLSFGDSIISNYAFVESPYPIQRRPGETAVVAYYLDTPPALAGCRRHQLRRFSASIDYYESDSANTGFDDFDVAHEHHLRPPPLLRHIHQASDRADVLCGSILSDEGDGAILTGGANLALKAVIGGALGISANTPAWGCALAVPGRGHPGVRTRMPASTSMRLLTHPSIPRLLTLADVDALAGTNPSDALDVDCCAVPLTCSASLAADGLSSLSLASRPPFCRGLRLDALGRAAFSLPYVPARTAAAGAAGDRSARHGYPDLGAGDRTGGRGGGPDITYARAASDDDLLLLRHRSWPRRSLGSGGAVVGSGGTGGTAASRPPWRGRAPGRNGRQDGRFRRRGCQPGYQRNVAAAAANANAKASVLATMAVRGASAWGWRWCSSTVSGTEADGGGHAHCTAAGAAEAAGGMPSGLAGTLGSVGVAAAVGAAAAGAAAGTAVGFAPFDAKGDMAHWAYGRRQPNGSRGAQPLLCTGSLPPARWPAQQQPEPLAGMPVRSLPYSLRSGSYDVLYDGDGLPAGACGDATIEMTAGSSLMISMEEAAAAAGAPAPLRALAAAAAKMGLTPVGYPWGDTSARIPEAADPTCRMLSFALGSPEPLARSLSFVTSFHTVGQAVGPGLGSVVTSAAAAVADAAYVGGGGTKCLMATTTMAATATAAVGAASVVAGSAPGELEGLCIPIRSEGGLASPIIPIGGLSGAPATGSITTPGTLGAPKKDSCFSMDIGGDAKGHREGAHWCEMLDDQDPAPRQFLTAADSEGAVPCDGTDVTIGPHGVLPEVVIGERSSPGEATVVVRAAKGEGPSAGEVAKGAVVMAGGGGVMATAAKGEAAGEAQIRRGLGARLLLRCFGRG